MITKTFVQSTLLACALTASVGIALADGLAPRASQGRSIIEGTWDVTITPYNCATSEEYSQFAFHSYLTFGAGGTLEETTSNPSFQPGQRSPGHGYWERAGRSSVHAVLQAFVQFNSVNPTPPAPPYQRGVQRLDQGIELFDADHWTSDAAVTFTNTAGEVVPPTGCAHASAVRMD
jgi:hypothetical protein